ncbi:hypothetical protein PQR57_15435 [Paraburkholderia dipogonis]|uniref:Uncharacterized protein n=1 Tax=Paraburkholderia dipogonis TaxID=1211383 RepID=A0ABW9APA3_9BURK
MAGDTSSCLAMLRRSLPIDTDSVGAAITNQVCCYPNANAAARAYMKPAILDDEAVYPRGEKMHSLTPSLPLPTEILRLQNRVWTQLKAGR